MIQDSANRKALPIGMIVNHMGNYNDLPTGFLLADGSAISRTTYAELFAKLGTKFGTGDGSTTFNLPSLTDRFPQGHATVTTNPGTTGGATNKTTSTYTPPLAMSDQQNIRAEAVAHSHTVADIRPKYIEVVPIIRAT